MGLSTMTGYFFAGETVLFLAGYADADLMADFA